jgi:hypothetical protein
MHLRKATEEPAKWPVLFIFPKANRFSIRVVSRNDKNEENIAK